MFDREDFEAKKVQQAKEQYRDKKLQKLALDVIIDSDKYGYGYQFTWLGLPIIQMPEDILITAEIIWQQRPDIIIETGIAWGGSVILYASILELIGKGSVMAVDLNLMTHVEESIMSYNFSNRIKLFSGSSTDAEIIKQIRSYISHNQSVMVILDSNHTHDHVLKELESYAPLVTKDQFLIVSDTVVNHIPEQQHRPRSWGPQNNPKTALDAYLEKCKRFSADPLVNEKLLLTYTPGGFFRCILD